MADMKLFLELLVKNAGFRRELENSGRAVDNFTKGSKREFEGLSGSVARFGQSTRREFEGLRNSYQSIQGTIAGLGLTYGFLQNQVASARLDKGLIQVKQTAGETTSRMAELRKEFFSMGRETGRDVERIKEGFDSLIQSGQSWRAAKETTGAINVANAVTGANEKTLAAGVTVGATAFNIDLEKPGRALNLLDEMVVAGRLGNAELENLSDIFARVGVNAQSAGFKFAPTLAFIEALSMVERQPERLATLADSTLRVFTNLKYMAEAQQGTGVKFFDMKTGTRRDPVVVLEEIRKKYQGLKTDAQRAMFIQTSFGHFDLDTIKGLRTLLSGGALAQIRSFTGEIEKAGGTLQEDLPEAINNAADQTGRLKAALREAGDAFAQPINDAAAKGVKYLLNKKSEGGLELSGKEIAGLTAGGIGTAAVLKMFGPRVAKRLIGGLAGTAVGVAEGKVLEKVAGVTPVFVTNWPANLGGSGTGSAVADAVGGAATAVGGKKAAGWLARNWKLLAGSSMATAAGEMAVGGLPYLLAAGGGYLAGYGINHGLGYLRGKVTNGKYSGQGWLGEELYDAFHPQRVDMRYESTISMSEARRAAAAGTTVKNDINLQVRIDKDGNIVAYSDNLDTRIRTDINRGDLENAILSPGL